MTPFRWSSRERSERVETPHDLRRRGDSVVPGVRRPVGLALLEELVATLDGLIGHVGEPGGLAGEDLLTHKAVVDRVSIHDLHATILHLLGIDHTRLTYCFNGRDFRLTDVYGTVVQNILS